MSSFDDYIGTFDAEPGYLNWAAFGPVSPSVRAEVFADADLLGSGRPSSLALVGERIGQAQEVIAELLGADAAEVTLQPSSTHGLMHALYGVSGAVVASTAEFPSVSLTLERAATASGRAVTPRWITPEDGRVTPDAVSAVLDDEVVALAVSHVDFRTGYRADLAALRDVLGPDRLLIVDAVQSFGVIDADYSVADVVVGHGYKWLRAGRGTGFAWFSPQARERIAPVLSGITGTTASGLFVDELPAPAPDAKAYTISVPDTLAAGRLSTGARDVRDAGVAAIEERVSAQVDAVIETADRHGIAVVSPRDRTERAGIVALAPEEPARLAAALANAGLVVTARGESIRVAPHAGTDAETLALLDETLGAFGKESFIVP
ncbi:MULTISPECIES: aminotransferase class V-fold PLP-dependent enzyme [Microbacterium]|uniref:aminotransferase class V-fold PLP-dependent enzyme n=1 Tax=Microbacterium TaxID=33882 RepID=UPI00246993FA|nr:MULTISPECIES: aminotransferase class V-fold PLP-dependent enzyme [Microbacterium]MDH5134128.1 aminotransferase class V-fold PLP-dependent enzyme [Microbacterium sp. RD10]MDH5137711.1 aminotransferase class V-fold PLP-dependent enzyme [Microbacterium sp. RD11]MDH5145257.1 aminotransferase class V-fold PLP-dependent enzyme [Microbacterium sp. RD12]MDH5155888.1 aminotransferase class V-fold PLP-dependent enzyme [Microbacterium sp. RD06]MDH5166110.1 aminotransferase class V-fold PLP-dependent e